MLLISFSGMLSMSHLGFTTTCNTNHDNQTIFIKIKIITILNGIINCQIIYSGKL